AAVVHARLEHALGRLDLRVEATKKLDGAGRVVAWKRRDPEHVLLLQHLDRGRPARLGGEDEGLRLREPDLRRAAEADERTIELERAARAARVQDDRLPVTQRAREERGVRLVRDR